MADDIEKRLNAFIEMEDELAGIVEEVTKVESEHQVILEIKDQRVDYDIVKSARDIYSGDVYDDYQYSRSVYYGLIQRGQVALDNALRVAQECEHPRAIEVSNQVLKNVAEITKDLMGLQKLMKELEGDKLPVPEHTTNNTTNNVYIGTQSDLDQALKKVEGSATIENENDSDDITPTS